jgi:drug/metabolite transporter (DMT)-like permease
VTGPLLALGSAALYGVADFAGGLLSRRASVATVALLGQVGGLLSMLGVACVVPAPHVTVADLGWGALSGVGTGVGMVFLYRGLSRGAMSVVVPVSAVGGVALPVLAGVVVFGARPSALAWLGIVVAVPALWLVSRTGADATRHAPAATVDALVASVGIAVQYLALARAEEPAGVWPVVAGRLAAVVAIVPMARQVTLPVRQTLHAALTGAAAALALVLYLLSTRQELVVVAVVLSSLYPVLPVLLGVTLLHERLGRTQLAGLAAAGAAIVLLTCS